MDDYNDLSDDYRKYRKEALEREREFIKKTQDRYFQLNNRCPFR